MQPLVAQYRWEAADARRRSRRIAEARPVTDDWVVRDIMVFDLCAFWRAGIAVWAIGCAAGGSLRCLFPGSGRLAYGVSRRDRERGLGALTGSVRQTGYLGSMPEAGDSVNDCGLFIEAWLILFGSAGKLRPDRGR